MGWGQVVQTVAPVFALAAVGYLIGRWRAVDLASLTEIVVYLAGPSLVFHSLTTGHIAVGEIGWVAGGAACIVLGVGLIVWLVAIALGLRPGVLYLPAMFMNSGNMLLPLSLFAFGEEGLHRGVVIFATMTMLQSSLGVTIASGRVRLGEMFRLPYVYAVLLAFAVRGTGTVLWPWLARPVALLGDMAIPLMLLALGLRLRSVELASWVRPLLVTVARVGGGYGVALAFVSVTGLHGVGRQCLLLASVMPAAVINFVFAEKYGNESGDVAAAVAVSTLVSLVTTPLVLGFGI